MRGIWALERALRWRPLAAGMMLDAWLLAAGVLAGAPVLVATAFARLLWQCQARLRTDVHFLYAALTGAMNLRETTAAIVLRRPTRLSRSELRPGAGTSRCSRCPARPASRWPTRCSPRCWDELHRGRGVTKRTAPARWPTTASS